LDQIAQQLKEEVNSLREHIQRSEERLLVAKWVDELMVPLANIEHCFNSEELSHIAQTLHKARHQFGVNGHLAIQLDDFLQRHAHLLGEEQGAQVPPTPTKDPQYNDELDFVEDEEVFEGLPFSQDSIDAPANPLSEASKTSAHEHARPLEALPANEPVQHSQVAQTIPSENTLNDLFDQRNSLPRSQPARACEKKTGTPSPTKIRQGNNKTNSQPTPSIDIFSARIDLDDLVSCMDIQLPEQDKVQLTQSLHNTLDNSSVAALQKTVGAEKQYILIPRITRFIYDGTLYPCTVKNLARTYIAFFGDIKDLMQYKGQSFLNHETPTLGWALITAEAAHETLDKSFMEQNQYLRYLSTSTGLPSHLVRRRTLVDTIYDLIIGRLVLSQTFLQHTLDWTSSGPNKSDYICVYFSERGIRLRHLARTQHNRVLGLCPNW